MNNAACQNEITTQIPLKVSIPILSDSYTPSLNYRLKKILWAAFRKRLKQDYVPELFQEVVDDIALFLVPVITAYMQGFEK